MLRQIFDQDGQFNSAYWVFLTDWSLWIWVLVGVVTIALAVLSWTNTSALPKRRRFSLFALRLTTLFLLFGLFLQPGVRLEDRNIVRNHVAVFIDNSRSMILPGQAEDSRLEQLKAFISKSQPLFKDWAEQHQIDFYTFGRYVSAIDTPSKVRAIGDGTDLTNAVIEVGNRYNEGDLAAVILVSDGADTGVLKNIKSNGGVPGSLRDRLKSLGAPVPYSVCRS